jgi:short-subunit dehydrogenase
MRTILVTGASDGIGQALAREFAGRGDRVLGVGRRPFEQVGASAPAADDYCVADLAAPESFERIAAFLDARGINRLDILIHNAAVGWYGAPAQQGPESIDLLLAVNLRAPIQLTHALLGRVRAAHGVVAFVSSVHTALPTPEFAVYTATKAALDGFARNLRIEERGAVDVVVLWPGPTRTQMHARSGVPPGRRRADAYPSPQVVAAQAAATIVKRKSRALGAPNRLLRMAGVYGEPLWDTLLQRLARRSTALRRGRVEAEGVSKGAKRYAVVTGGAEGIGRALLGVLHAQEYGLAGIDVNAAAAAQAQAELSDGGAGVSFLHCDLGRTDDLAHTAALLLQGPDIDLLVHSAGINHVAPFAASDADRQLAVVDVNLRAPLQLTAALLQGDKIAHGATIVFISSLSRYVGYPGAAVYAATKDGLASYARSLAVALAPQGVRVLVVYPGPTRTAHARRYSPDNSREARRMAPDVVAMAIYRAVVRRQHTLIPGTPNRLAAALGRWLPWATDRVMKRTVFDKL